MKKEQQNYEEWQRFVFYDPRQSEYFSLLLHMWDCDLAIKWLTKTKPKEETIFKKIFPSENEPKVYWETIVRPKQGQEISMWMMRTLGRAQALAECKYPETLKTTA